MAQFRRLDAAAVDLNLLRPLYTLLTERGITRAAKACGMSQPAMSRTLERLRAMLGDELLIRGNGGYVLTPRAEQLRIDVRELLSQIDLVIRGETFDPLQSRESFRIVTPEYGALLVVTQLVTHLRSLAPNVSLAVDPWSDAAFDMVAAGRYDLAIAPLDGARGLETAALFEDDFACVVDEHHPLREACDIDAYLAYPHAVLSITEGQQPWIDRPLRVLGRARRVAFRTAWASTAMFALHGTDLVFTATWRWWRTFHPAGLRIVRAPPEFDSFRYGMAWHARLASHPAHVWFRSLVAALAADAGAAR